jgi:hypothetical protein
MLFSNFLGKNNEIIVSILERISSINDGLRIKLENTENILLMFIDASG